MRYCQACHRCFGDGVEFCLFDHTLTRTASSLPLVIEGKYRLEQLIAHGGMGSVYRATHLGLDREVAIKILRAELLADTTARERFNREARAAGRLKHPNIVAVYDSGHLPNGSAYLVMELIEGRSLREEIKAHASRLGQMRAERAAAILTQVCAGIEAAHRHGIVHRDLKPDNVMIETATDGTERVLVLDFGIAKLAVPAHAECGEQVWQGLTDENTVIGTPNYISPEQCTGNTVDARSDIYSLGVILYEMLTGHVPFAGQNTSTVLLKHLQEPPAPPHRFCPDIHPALEQVVLQALAKNPQQRFSSASEFARHLLAAISTRDREPAGIAVPSGEVEDRTMTAPRPVMSSTIAIAAASPSPWREQPSGETKAPTLLIERRSRARLVAITIFLAVAAISTLAYFLYGDRQAEADEAPVASTSSEPTPVASSSPDGVQNFGQKADQVVSTANSPSTELQLKQAKQTQPAAYVKPAAATLADEKVRREVRAAYSDWAMAAAKGEWQKHANFYADKVEYFRDGTMTRSKVVSRKRAIFGKLDSYWLRFSESPQIVLKNTGGQPEADVTFDRSWTLRRGRKQTSGRAQGMITLRREARGWRIVSEKQIKK